MIAYNPRLLGNAWRPRLAQAVVLPVAPAPVVAPVAAVPAANGTLLNTLLLAGAALAAVLLFTTLIRSDTRD